jgi:hypothetical protein
MTQALEAEKVASTALPAVDARVQGYVVSTSTMGCFVKLSRSLTSRVMLRNLSTGFVNSVEKGTYMLTINSSVLYVLRVSRWRGGLGRDLSMDIYTFSILFIVVSLSLSLT